jgi:hypothetical protein
MAMEFEGGSQCPSESIHCDENEYEHRDAEREHNTPE